MPNLSEKLNKKIGEGLEGFYGQKAKKFNEKLREAKKQKPPSKTFLENWRKSCQKTLGIYKENS